MTAAAVSRPLIDAARAWYDAGYCVIPSHEDGGKRPFGAWKKYQHARPEWAELEGWLSSGRYTGIGVITGAVSGNVEMIEIEGPEEAAAKRLNQVIELADSRSEVGTEELLLRAVHGCSETSAGGGLHMFVRVTDGPVPGNTKLAMDDTKVVAETRGEGGFVIVWPTTARTGHAPGSVYLLWGNSKPSQTAAVTSEELDMLHTIIGVGLGGIPDEPPPRTSAPAPSARTGLSPFDDYRQRMTWAQILQPAGWTWHSRDDEKDYWTRPGKATNDGQSANTIEDGAMVLWSTSVHGMPTGVGISKADVYAYIYHRGDRSAAARALRQAGYGDPDYDIATLPPWLVGAGDTDAPEEDLRAEYVREHLSAIDWHALWADQTEEEWIAYPILPARRLVALYSAPKVGKSLLLLEMAAGIAAGREVLGNPPGPRRTVLYVDFENDPKADIRERLQNMGYGPDDLDQLRLLSFPTMGTLDSERGSQELMAAIQHYGAEVVVVDTVSRAIAGDENENDTWLDFYRCTGLKLKQAGVALVRLDHAGKDEAKGQRGGSAKSGDVDAVWRMSRVNDDLFDLVCEANRMPIDPESRILTLERVEGDRLRHVVKGDRLRAKREALDAAIEACGPYPEGARNWKAIRAKVSETHPHIKASSETWSAAVKRHFMVPALGDHVLRQGVL